LFLLLIRIANRDKEYTLRGVLRNGKNVSGNQFVGAHSSHEQLYSGLFQASRNRQKEAHVKGERRGSSVSGRQEDSAPAYHALGFKLYICTGKVAMMREFVSHTHENFKTLRHGISDACCALESLLLHKALLQSRTISAQHDDSARFNAAKVMFIYAPET